MENSRNVHSSSAELGMSVCLLVQHLHRQQGKAGVLLKAEVEERPVAAQGSIRRATAAHQPGPPQSRQGNGAEPRVHMHAGWEGGEGGGRQGGGRERAIREQGRERSWQQPRSAKREPSAGLGRKESAEGHGRTRRLSVCPRRRHCPPRTTGVQRTPNSAEGAGHARGWRARGRHAAEAGPGRLCTRWHERRMSPSSWKLASLEPGVLGVGVFYCSPSSLSWARAGGAGSAAPTAALPRATRRWRSTVCSA